jgi:hypothetical protein
VAKLGAAALKFDSCPRHGIHPQIHTSSHGRVFPARQSPSSLAARAQRPPWPCRAPSARAQLLCSLASAVLWSVEDLLRAQPELLPWPWPRYSGSSPWRLLGPALSRVCSCARPPARSHAFLSPWTCALRFSLPRPRRGSAQLDLCSSGAVESLRTRCSFPFSSSSARREFSSGAGRARPPLLPAHVPRALAAAPYVLLCVPRVPPMAALGPTIDPPALSPPAARA